MQSLFQSDSMLINLYAALSELMATKIVTLSLFSRGGGGGISKIFAVSLVVILVVCDIFLLLNKTTKAAIAKTSTHWHSAYTVARQQQKIDKFPHC